MNISSQSISSAVKITELGMGVSQFGNLNRETSDEASVDAVLAAHDAGIRYFDTAPHYGLGLSERRLGLALRELPRDSFTLSTKVGRLLVDSPETADQIDTEGFLVPARTRRVWDFSRDGVLRSIEASLERLGLDRIDIAYLHDPDDHWEQASTTGVEALIELRDQGVIGAIGAGMNQSALLSDLVRRADVDIVMVAGRLTLLDQRAVTDLLPAALERGVAVVAAGVYNSGLLASSVVPDSARFDYAPAPAEVVERAHRIAAICRDHGVDLPTAAVQYPLRHASVASVVLGMRTADHVRSSITRLSTPIPVELWAELDSTGMAPDLMGKS